MKQRTVYMAVTNDRYELPLAIGDTVSELAQELGVKRKTISEVMCHYKLYRRRSGRSKYIRVVIDDEP